MSKVNTLQTVEGEQLKISIARIKRFLNLTEDEFSQIFIDREGSGALKGSVRIYEKDVLVMIHRSSKTPKFFCIEDPEHSILIAEAFQKIFPSRSKKKF